MTLFKLVKNVFLTSLFLGFVLVPSASAQDQKIYVFGNSLFNHVSGSDTTTVPHWLSLLARKQRVGFSLDGEFGFIRSFATKPTPSPNWHFQSVKSGWDPERTSFARSNISEFIIVPANFIQYQPPSENYDGDGPRMSPVEATERLIDMVEDARPGSTFYIYEGWSDMGGFVHNMPPGPEELERYYSYNAGEYHDWYVDYVAILAINHNVELIPVAKVLAALLTQAPLNQISPQDLYVDSAPHGTATLYFLAAMVTFAAVFDEPLPSELAIPRSVNPVVADAYSQIATEIPELLAEFRAGK